MSGLVSIAIVLLIFSIVYISYYYSKRKKFPGVIIGTLINNFIILFAFFISFTIVDKYFFNLKEIIIPFLALIPTIQTIYLLKSFKLLFC